MAGPLKNTRHERFAQELAKGSSADDAYVAAGFKENRGNAARLKANESIQARVAELQAKGAERAEISVARVLAELARIGFSDIRKAVRWRSHVLSSRTDEETGEVEDFFTTNVDLVDSEEIDDDTAAAIAEISQTDKGGLKVKFYDKRAALVDIGKHLGMFTEKHEHSGPNGGPIAHALDLSGLTQDERDALRAILSRRAG